MSADAYENLRRAMNQGTRINILILMQTQGLQKKIHNREKRHTERERERERGRERD